MTSTAALDKIGKLWIHPKTGEKRWYVNKAWKLVGLEVSYYKSGYISYSALKGEEVSHGRAGKMIATLDKFWITEDGECHASYIADKWFYDYTCTEIKGILASLEEAEEVQ